MSEEPKLVHHTKKNKTNIWMITTVILAVLFVASVFTSGFKFGGVSGETASDSVSKYIKTNLPDANATVETLGKVEAYLVKVDIDGQSVESIVTEDGKKLYPQPISLEVEETEPTQTQTQTQPKTEIEKSDKPEVELFVMSHCPFGTQAEKGMIPAVKALGDSIDFKLRFVYYAMHGEKEVLEQLNQYCIQKEQNDKLLDYLECFLADGEGETCLTEAGIDVEKMNACTEAADKEFEITKNLEDEDSWLNGRFPLFNTDKEANTAYGIRGSPSLVINGASSSAGRDSASYLTAICEAFNEKPEACSQELSAEAPGAGFGYDKPAAASSGSCG